MIDFEITYDLEEIDVIASKILDQFTTGIILFYGEIGAGKTTLINALLKSMRSSDTVNSPTFSIVNEYQTKKEKIYHFDFYRISSLEEAYNFGVEEYLNSDHKLFIEWPEVIIDLIPEHYQSISIEKITKNKRSLKLTSNKERLTLNTAYTEVKL